MHIYSFKSPTTVIFLLQVQFNTDFKSGKATNIEYALVIIGICPRTCIWIWQHASPYDNTEVKTFDIWYSHNYWLTGVTPHNLKHPNLVACSSLVGICHNVACSYCISL